ncbi:hypothetical protein CU007_2619 [Enterococcus faecium]|nr:hypothetical protein [Enterococcus faecium]MBK4873545.1 hypothetical protein [Enterococcus faecium]MBK4884308.1 hypothetical protein [Enterococcus faecium]
MLTVSKSFSLTSDSNRSHSSTSRNINIFLSELVLPQNNKKSDVELMSNTTYATASVITLSPFEVIIVPFQDDQDSIFKNLTFMTTLAKGLSENLINSSHNYTSNALYSGEQRLCTYILQGSYKNYFFDNLTDVAATIGISYRHLLRLLNKLCDDGILKREKRKFQITDMKQLKYRSSEAEYFKINH